MRWRRIGRTLLAAEKCSYILGNPPFGGAKYQSAKQGAQVRRIASLGGSGGTLDYVCPWFIKAGDYLRTSKARIGFVATNSITQGEQVAQVWPLLFDRYELEIAFAHRTFEWMSDAKGKAHVHCVIIGLTRRDDEPKDKRLFYYDDIRGDPKESKHGALTPYLFDASSLVDRHLVVKEVSKSLCDSPKMIIGSKPIDGGYYIFTDDERLEFLASEPSADQFLRPYLGSDEFINGDIRYILALQNVSPEVLRAMPKVVERTKCVSRFRRGEIPSKKEVADGKTETKARGKDTVKLADYPQRFHVNVGPKTPYLVIPKVSSERRDYVPIGWLQPPIIPSDLLFVLQHATLADFALITSRMHMAWLRNIGGRLKNDYRYSIGIVYNPFPWPDLDEAAKAKIEKLAKGVLDARAAHKGATLSDLYDPDVMPEDLRKAHRALDEAVDKLYRKAPFASDRERVEHLFGLYEKLTAPMLAAAGKSKRGRKK